MAQGNTGTTEPTVQHLTVPGGFEGLASLWYVEGDGGAGEIYTEKPAKAKNARQLREVFQMVGAGGAIGSNIQGATTGRTRAPNVSGGA